MKRALLLIYLFTFSLMLVSCVEQSKTKLNIDAFSIDSSILTVSNSQVGAGATARITLYLKTSSGKSFLGSKHDIAFSLTGGTSVGSIGAITNNQDGSFSATFTGINPGTPKTIKATVNGKPVLTTTPTVEVTIGNFSLAHSILQASASSVDSGDNITVTLTARDTSGTQLEDGGLNVLFSHSGGTSTGTWSAVTDNLDGTYTATFSGVTAGAATRIYASIGGGTVTTTSPTVTVNIGAAAKLAFVQQPTTVASGATIIATTPVNPSAITVRALDVNNNFVASYATDIVIAIGTNPSGGALLGTLTQTPSSGISTFNDLSINFYGTGYTLSATSGSLTAATSSVFNITPVAVTYNIPFTSITTPAYTTLYTSSSWTLMDFINDLVRLTPIVHADDAATAGTMNAGATSGIVMGTLADGLSSGLKLGNSGSCNGITTDCAKQSAAEIYELHSSWTPRWASLVSYWKLDNNWNDSKGSNHLTTEGTASFSPNAKIGMYAGSFDGSSTVAKKSSSVNLSGYTAHTVGFWFKRTISDDSQALFLFYDSPFNNYMGCEYYYNAINCFNYNSSAGPLQGELIIPDASLPAMGTWTHLYLVWNGSSYKAYVNGVLVLTDSSSAGTFASVTYATNIGGYDPADVGANYGWNGQVDDFAIWSVALSEQEIKTIYERQKSQFSGTFTSRVMDAKSSSIWTTLSWLPTLPFLKELPDYASSAIQNETASDYTSLPTNTLMNGIIGLFHLNETGLNGSAGEIRDDSGSGNHGIFVNGSANTETSLFNGGIATGTVAEKYFNTGTGYGSIFTADNLSSTISLWIKPSGAGNVIAEKANGEGAWKTSLMQITGACTVIASVWNNALITRNIGTCEFNKWNHIVWRYNGVKLTGSVNGVIDNTGVTTPKLYPTPNTQPNQFFTFGTPSSGQCTECASINAIYDEIAIWNRAITDTEIGLLHQRGASRLKYQVRTCNDGACAGESWQGPDGTTASYFSELNNNTTPLTAAGDVKATLPSMLFSNFTTPPGNNQYFQYRAIFESDSATTSVMPELKSVNVGPVHYDASSPSIYGNNGVAFSELNSFTEILGAGGCDIDNDGNSDASYNLSLDKITWKYWNGAAWVTANGTAAQSNIAAVIQTNSATFGTQVGKGNVYVKSFLKSSGTTKCELNNIQFGGNR
jgi:hypothetical protein